MDEARLCFLEQRVQRVLQWAGAVEDRDRLRHAGELGTFGVQTEMTGQLDRKRLDVLSEDDRQPPAQEARLRPLRNARARGRCLRPRSAPPGEGSTPGGAEAAGSARCRARRRAPRAPCGMPRAPRLGAPTGRARASTGHTAAHARDAARRSARGRQRARHDARLPAAPRRAPRPGSAVVLPGGRSPSARTSRRRARRARRHARLRGPHRAAGRVAAGHWHARRRRAAARGRRRGRPTRDAPGIRAAVSRSRPGRATSAAATRSSGATRLRSRAAGRSTAHRGDDRSRRRDRSRAAARREVRAASPRRAPRAGRRQELPAARGCGTPAQPTSNSDRPRTLASVSESLERDWRAAGRCGHDAHRSHPHRPDHQRRLDGRRSAGRARVRRRRLWQRLRRSDHPPTQRRRAGGFHEAQLRGRRGRDAEAPRDGEVSSPSRSSARVRAATVRCRALQ